MTTDIQSKLLPTLDFLLFDWLELGTLLEREYFSDHTPGSVRDILRTVSDVAGEVIEPANRALDTHEPAFDGARVTVPAETHAAWEAYTRLELASASHPHEHGGHQLPRTAELAIRTIVNAASASFSPAILTDANASLILAHGTPPQRAAFAAKELDGEWSGTMCLSEPHAGSSLADITTQAVPEADGGDDPLGPRYRVSGQKMWISGGDHDLTQNIVHLVLARTEHRDGSGNPATGRLSLFIVPKILCDTSGRLLERNDVVVTGLNHKLGFRGIPNTALAFGAGAHLPGGRSGAIGYLVGSPGDGLRQMFHMMNAARIEVGSCAAALGFAGFATSLAYARERRQGRPTGADPADPPRPIVEHADVQRMLLAQKSYAEGGIALGLYTARLLDDERTGTAAQRDRARALLDILTPIVKSWPSEWCLEANSLAIQVMGGAGYVRDHPVEQYWRDNRLNMIHEGTHGIQGRDLLGRKVRIDDGFNLETLGRELRATTQRARALGFADEAASLESVWHQVLDATRRAWKTSDRDAALADATPYLQGFGHVVIAWTWLHVAVAAHGSSHAEAAGKLAAMTYFFDYELPKVTAWLTVVTGERPSDRSALL